MSSDAINLRGIILTSQEFGEKDRILGFLSDSEGLVSICVKGAQGRNSKNSSLSLPFSVCDITVRRTGNYYYSSDFAIVESNSGIMASLEAMAVASHFSKILASTCYSSESTHDLYVLACYAFFSLAKNPERYMYYFVEFNWRVLSIIGLTINYDTCISCSNSLFNSEKLFISYVDGKAVCESCLKGAINRAQFQLLSSKAVFTLNYLKSAQIKDLFITKIDEVSLEQLSSFTSLYMQQHLELEINTLQTLKEYAGIGLNCNPCSNAQDKG